VSSDPKSPTCNHAFHKVFCDVFGSRKLMSFCRGKRLRNACLFQDFSENVVNSHLNYPVFWIRFEECEMLSFPLGKLTFPQCGIRGPIGRGNTDVFDYNFSKSSRKMMNPQAFSRGFRMPFCATCNWGFSRGKTHISVVQGLLLENRAFQCSNEL